MKKRRMRLFSLLIFMILCSCVSGCANNNPKPEETKKPKNNISEAAIEETNMPKVASTISEDEMMYHGTILYHQSAEDKVCLRIAPPGVRKYVNYYYIPTGEIQKKLLGYMDGLEGPWEVKDRRWEGMKETGCWLYYKGKNYRIFEGGYFYSSDDENGEKELLVHEKDMYDYIQQILWEQLDYRPYDIAQIKDIASARLEMQAKGQLYSQTVTEKETLEQFEDWFRNGEYILGGVECGNQSANLELTLKNGDIIQLSMATDSCTNFGVNGVYYDYRPEGGWYSENFFQRFDQIPWER